MSQQHRKALALCNSALMDMTCEMAIALRKRKNCQVRSKDNLRNKGCTHCPEQLHLSTLHTHWNGSSVPTSTTPCSYTSKLAHQADNLTNICKGGTIRGPLRLISSSALPMHHLPMMHSHEGLKTACCTAVVELEDG